MAVPHKKLEAGALLTRARWLLKARPHNLKLYEIARETDLPLGWLKTLQRNGAPDVNRVEVLINYFEKRA